MNKQSVFIAILNDLFSLTLSEEKETNRLTQDISAVLLTFIEWGLDINTLIFDKKTRQNQTLLELAIQLKSLKIVQALVERGIDIEKKHSINLYTPLFQAMNLNEIDIVKYLLKKGADSDNTPAREKLASMPSYHFISPFHSTFINFFRQSCTPFDSFKDINGNTALHVAIARNINDIAEILISDESVLDEKNSANETPLDLIFKTKNLRLAKCVAEQFPKKIGEYPHKNKGTPLHWAVDEENIELVTYFDRKFPTFKTAMLITDYRKLSNIITLRQHLDFSYFIYRTLPIHLAVKKNNLALVKALVETGSSISSTLANKCEKMNTPLGIALYYNHRDIMDFMLEQLKATFYPDNMRCVTNNDNYFDNIIINNLLDKQSIFKDILSELVTLKLAEENEQTRLTQDITRVFLSFIEWGMDINSCLKKGTTLLEIGISLGSLQIVQALVERGANIEHKDFRGFTALFQAIASNNVDIVKYLLEHKANIHNTPSEILSPLHLALTYRHLELVKFLIRKDPRALNQVTPENESMFYLAAAAFTGNNFELLNFLAKQNALWCAPSREKIKNDDFQLLWSNLDLTMLLWLNRHLLSEFWINPIAEPELAKNEVNSWKQQVTLFAIGKPLPLVDNQSMQIEDSTVKLSQNTHVFFRDFANHVANFGKFQLPEDIRHPSMWKKM